MLGYIDVEASLERVMNDREFYMGLLQGFLAADDMTAIRTAWQKKDYTALLECIHSLKGVASNFGLNQLHEAVIRLEDTLHDKGNMAGEYQQLMDCFMKTNAAIRRFLEEEQTRA